MDRWNPIDSAITTLGFDPTGVREGGQSWSGFGDPTGVRSGNLGMGGDPTGVDQWSYGDMGRMWGDPTLGRGFDPLLDIGLASMGVSDPNENVWNPSASGSNGAISSLGGDWSSVDQWNQQIMSASGQYGVPANLIKAVMKLESGGNANIGENGATAVGLMQVTRNNWGDAAARMGLNLDNPADNIAMGAYILKQNYTQYAAWATMNGIDPWKAAVYSYYAGNPYDMSAADSPAQGGSGMSTGAYGDVIWNNYQMLNANAGGAGKAQPIGGMWGGNQGGNNIVNIAQQYLGTPYVWGGIPGKGETPTGWDCSGFTYWLDQNYGSGQLPMGSHYQYQHAQQNGLLFNDMSQLQPGDLVFFDTGNTAGGGAELNRAGHVAMYIGNGQIIHAANPSQGTIISNINDGYYNQRYIGSMHASYSGAVNMGAGTAPSGGGGYRSARDTINWFLTDPNAKW